MESDHGIDLIKQITNGAKQYGVCLIAEIIKYLLDLDTTEPDPNNPRNGWNSDLFLRQIEAFFINQRGEPATYCQIVRLARSQIDSNQHPAAAVLLDLHEFNAERRLSDEEGREKYLDTRAGFLERLVSQLPDGPMQVRCQELLLYNVGVFRDAYGHFAQAAEMQNQAAARADFNANKAGAAICRFVEMVYRLKHALYQSSMGGAMSVFAVLELRYSQLAEVTHGTAFEVQWGRGNGPCAMIEACAWLDKMNHPELNNWVATGLAAAEKLGPAWQPIAEFIQAVGWYGQGYHQRQSSITALTRIAQDTTQANDRRATVLLLLARDALAVGQQAGLEARSTAAKMAAEFIAQMPEQGAQHIIAIAKRELARFEQAGSK
jgi:hypothetical protein